MRSLTRQSSSYWDSKPATRSLTLRARRGTSAPSATCERMCSKTRRTDTFRRALSSATFELLFPTFNIWILMGSMTELYLDDHLIETFAGVRRRLHRPRKHLLNPILRPEKWWEGNQMLPYATLYDEDE